MVYEHLRLNNVYINVRVIYLYLNVYLYMKMKMFWIISLMFEIFLQYLKLSSLIRELCLLRGTAPEQIPGKD